MKRILSIILTLSIVATLFAGLGLNASAATNYAEKMTVTHSNYAGGNLSLPTSGSVITKAPTISYWNYDSAAGTTTHYKTWYNTAKSAADIAKLYDGNLTNIFESAYTSNNTNKYLKLKEGATAGSTTVSDYESVDDGSFYLQIQYDLEDCYGNGVDLDKIIIYGHQRFWTMGSYDLFISDNIQTLYDSPVYSYDYLELNGSEIGSYANSKKNFTEYTFEEGTTAKFVAIRIYKCHAMTDKYFTSQCTSFGTVHARIGEFNVYGTRSTANNQGYELTSAAYNSTGGDQTLTAATAAGIGNNISTSLIRDCAPTEYKYSNLGATNTANVSGKKITQSNDFKRFDVNTSVRFAGTDNKGYKYIIDNENNYQQWIYALDAEADIDSIVVATNQWGTSAISGSLFAPYHVQYSLANNKDDLFVDGASTIYDVYNTDAAAFLTINLTEDVTAKFVGLRVVCGVNKLYPYTDHPALTGNNVAWARLSYFGVNGTYVNPAEATVEVEKDAAVADVEAITVSKGKVAQSGITDTNGKFPVGSIQVNATETYKDVENKLEYTFEGWYNGETPVSEEPEYTYDLTGGDVVLTAKYDVKNIVTKHTVTFKDWDGTELKTETVEEGNAATAPADPAREGYTFVRWDADFSNVTDNLIVNAVYEINKYTVTFMADDKLVEAVEVEYGKAATAPAAPAKDGYTFVRWDADFSNVTDNLIVNAVYEINKYTVTFKSVTGVELGKVVVAEGDAPDYDAVKDINANVKTVYGYNIMRKDNGDVVWDADVYGTGIVNNITVTPRYEAIEGLNTNVKVYDVDGTKLIDQDARYDSAIYLASRQGAKSWTDAKEGGNVLIAEPTGTLYACGSAMEIYAKAEALEAEKVAIVGKNHEAGKGFSIFAHVNVEGATEFGVIFSSSKYHDEVNADFTIEDLTPNRVTNVEVETANVEGKVDFMTTLNYSDSLPNPTRYARAYVVVNNEYIYSDVICNK